MYPKVIFKLNKKLDKRVAEVFLSVTAGGINFSRTIIQDHPELIHVVQLHSKVRRNKAINSYVDSFYKKEHIDLLKSILSFNNLWRTKERRFFKVTNEIFNLFPFPQGRYIGYISIFNCNPRFLHNKTFQVYYRHQHGAVYVTMHELLHFIFYAYTKKKYPHLFEKLDPDSGNYWIIAELFNTIVLADPVMEAMHGAKRLFAYPEHKKYLPKLKLLWEKKHSVDTLILEGFQYINCTTH